MMYCILPGIRYANYDNSASQASEGEPLLVFLRTSHCSTFDDPTRRISCTRSFDLGMVSALGA
jgi:hypothetical protein